MSPVWGVGLIGQLMWKTLSEMQAAELDSQPRWILGDKFRVAVRYYELTHAQNKLSQF